MNNHSANSYEATERIKIQKVKLGEAFELQMGKTPSRNNTRYWNGDISWAAISDITESKYLNSTKEHISEIAVKESGIKVVPANTVIMSFKLSIGKAVITQKPLFTNEAIMAFIDKKLFNIDVNYVYYLLNNYNWADICNKAVKGLTLNKATLSDVEINLPPIEEQRAIAEKLDKVSQLVDKRKEQLQQLDQLVKSQFIDMFGDPAIDEDNGDTLGDYFNIVSGGTPDTKNMDYWQNGTIPWIGSSSCQNCVIKTVNQKFITQMGLQHSSSKILGAGTVLVALVGATIGKTALLKCETAINQNIAGIKVLENKQFTPQYVFYAMQFLYKKFTEIGGDKFKMANLTFIRGLPFAKQPIVLQNKFAEFVEMVDKLKEKVNNSLTHLNLLKQSLMQQYFG